MKDFEDKRNEVAIIEKFQEYVKHTYEEHYEGKISPLEVFESLGIAEDAYKANIIKYLFRYQKKGNAKKDIFKIMHYSLLLYDLIEKQEEAQKNA